MLFTSTTIVEDINLETFDTISTARLTIGVLVTAAALVVALILLATLTAKQKLLIVEKETLVEECKTSEWLSDQTRLFVQALLSGESALGSAAPSSLLGRPRSD
ncbi:putative transmembrane protein [Toxoplasma gondii RUB]|uniref:Putative transmembrane protein n=1 Tax=Toxoplasma gondii RUB TaxID=935652 RepID=A0A086LQ06_TOXGO|nr:putative transmembrane protein [Toxoplasma gondii RUB]